MNAKKSNKFQYWKYAFSIPLLFVLLLLLNRPSTTYAISETALEQDNKGLSEASDDVDAKSEIPEELNVAIAKPDEHKSGEPSEEVSNAAISDANISKILNANCKEFEQAVANGDLEKVKEILKTLDPDCLQLNQKDSGNLKSVKSLVMDMHTNIDPSEEIIFENETICDRIRIAVDTRNQMQLRKLLEEEDISCLNDIYGDPTRMAAFIKGLLSYDADMNIDRNGVINIDQIGFRIGISDYEAFACEDSHYLQLVNAIKTFDDYKVRKILSTEVLSCPLNVDGITNDFIFIKELMKYSPKITNYDGKSIQVHGVGVTIDLDKKIDKPQSHPSYKNISTVNEKNENESDSEALLENSQEGFNSMGGIENYPKNNMDNQTWSCADLVEAVLNSDFDKVLDNLQHIDPNCFYGEKTTITNWNGSHTYSQVTTPLLAAARDGNVNFIIHLIENHADVNYRVDEDETALMAAVKAGSVAVAAVLLRHGANVNWTDLDNMTALDYVKRDKHFQLIKFLELKGAKANKYSMNDDIEKKIFKNKEQSKLKCKAIWKFLC